MKWTADLYYDEPPRRVAVKESRFARLLWWAGLLVLPAIEMVDMFLVTIHLNVLTAIAVAIALCEVSVLCSRRSLGKKLALALLGPCLVVAEIIAIGICSLSVSGFDGML